MELVVNVLYLSQDFLGINFEMAFQRTDYDFVCYVLLTHSLLEILPKNVF